MLHLSFNLKWRASVMTDWSTKFLELKISTETLYMFVMPFIMHTQSGVSLRDQCKKYQTQGPSCQCDPNLNLILTSKDKSVINFIAQ